MISYYTVKFDGHRHCGSGDLPFLERIYGYFSCHVDNSGFGQPRQEQQ